MYKAVQRKNVGDIVAQIIRALTIPAVLVAALLVALYFIRPDVIRSFSELLFSLLFLAIVPLLAYPVSYIVPSLKKKGREGQRQLAFILNLVGYVAALAYGFIAYVSEGLLLIFITYCISVLVLMFFNKVIKKRASGHACGVTGPLLFFVYFTGPLGLIPCVLVAVGVVWSSLRLKRHTVSDLLLGALTALVALLVSILIVSVL